MPYPLILIQTPHMNMKTVTKTATKLSESKKKGKRKHNRYTALFPVDTVIYPIGTNWFWGTKLRGCYSLHLSY